MPRGYRSLIIVSGAMAVLTALGVGAFFGSLYGPDRKQYVTVAGDKAGQNDYQGPSQSLSDISGLPGFVERAIANPRPETGKDHEKRELAAQEASALWASWMVLASFLSVLITAAGTILLYKQIVLTRKAVEDTGRATQAMNEANQITQAINRPFVIASPFIDHFEAGEGYISLTIRVVFKNIGATAAAGYWPVAEPFFVNESFEAPNAFFKNCRLGCPADTEFLMPGEEFSLISKNNYPIELIPWSSNDGDEKISFLVCASVVYRIFGKRDDIDQFCTQETFRVGLSGHNVVMRRWLYKRDLNGVQAKDLVLISDRPRHRR